MSHILSRRAEGYLCACLRQTTPGGYFMFRHLVRWLVRLFFFALIAGVVGFVITRLMGGEDDDFEDFEDLESSFEFNETPVEIDVSGPATSGESTMASADASSDTDSAPEY